ncbi:MAG: UDP-N-acetylmuramoyl-L-alanine--D-glutamate ligase [Rickettsiaceae bacterium]|nr:MAG: UDP-N-acetylmuramoyl-L-alanine--D-glutamate ligase [Rickettsiaceae bacterium]
MIIQSSSFEYDRIGILGLSRTGIAVFRALRNRARELLIWDDNPQTRQIFTQQFDSSFLVSPSDPRWQSLDKFIPSPGIDPNHHLIKNIINCGIDIVSDIDILFAQSSSSKFISVTGTNGKSTTTALIYHVLKSLNINYHMGGNIGIPVLDLPIKAQGYIIELSSFQLELIKDFRSDIAILLNITQDHLDRHKTFANYIEIKKSIISTIRQHGSAVISVDDINTRNIFEELKQKNFSKNLISISTSIICQGGVSVIDNELHDQLSNSTNIFDLPFNIHLQGAHNAENIAASYAACRTLGIEADKILQSIKTFVGLAHRAQYIGTYLGINFYNDSKATNGFAASKSINFLDNVFWIAGGTAKDDGIKDLIPYFNKIRKAYLYGRDSTLFATTLRSKVNFELFDTLEQAFWAATKDACLVSGMHKNILLSPAAASYDQFKDFEERGNTFISLYHQLVTQRD